MNASPAARYDIHIDTAEDWGGLARHGLDGVVDPLVYRLGQFFLEGSPAGPERWPVIAADLGALVTFFDQIVLHDQLAAFNYPDVFDIEETVHRDRLGAVLNTEGDHTLVHVEVSHAQYRLVKAAALQQLSDRMCNWPLLPLTVGDEVVRELHGTRYQWQPSLEYLEDRVLGERDKELARFLLGQLVFTGYAQQTGAPHIVSPQRSRLIGGMGIGVPNPLAVSEAAIYRELARRVREAGPGWRSDVFPWTPSFLPYLVDTMANDRGGPDELLRRARELRDSRAVQRYRRLRDELAAEDADRSERARRALTRAANGVATELGSPRERLELVRPVVVEVLPSALAAGLGAMTGLLVAGPPGAIGGAVVAAISGHAFELVSRRLWGWSLDRLPFRSARKLLTRSVKAEHEIGADLGPELERIWARG
ncbi:hypothetical protein [Nocardia sp. NPDC052566]|uniref:hypothetical protein n=1 Tax=Nocardia sp. NPDC052566 TaxID=3364330 RepID=UPI0037C998CC